MRANGWTIERLIGEDELAPFLSEHGAVLHIDEKGPGVYKVACASDVVYVKHSRLHHRPFWGTEALVGLYRTLVAERFYPKETRVFLNDEALCVVMPKLDLWAFPGADAQFSERIRTLSRFVSPEEMHGDVWITMNYGHLGQQLAYMDLEVLNARGRTNY